ncbi:MAG: outer membrane beta-barrel protein [Opitutaceae bacterium]|nr:outer membrane beta-barrel protein [Opitutaceae bacterium]
MKKLLTFVFAALFLPSLVWAVYAPVPDQEQGKALSFRISAASYYDTNLFGAASGAIDSMVYNVTPSVSFNGSVTDQTFVSAGYDLSLDHMPDRPSDHTLVSQTLNARLAHAFTQQTNVDLTDMFQIAKNPQSLLAGIPLNTDQSFKRNEFSGRFATALNAKTGVLLKYRNVIFDYDNAALGHSLNRMEHLTGVEFSYAFMPETKLAGEYRYQAIAYDHASDQKDKRSHFLLGGVDHALGENITLSGRAGAEDRRRESERSTTSPYAELTANYRYAVNSFVTGGYTYSIDESSDTVRFTDSKANRFFVNVQHALTALVSASGSFTYEAAQLQGRRGVNNVAEDTIRAGAALTWTPTKNWAVSATYDYDHTSSDDSSRRLKRNRVGGSMRYSF